MSSILHFGSAFADAQAGFDQALQDQQDLLTQIDQDLEQDRQQGISRHFYAAGAYIREVANAVIPHATETADRNA